MRFLRKLRARQQIQSSVKLADASGRGVPAESFLLACGVEQILDDQLTGPGGHDQPPEHASQSKPPREIEPSRARRSRRAA